MKLIKKIRDWVEDRRTPIIQFVSSVGNFSVATPVATASRIKPKWLRLQTGKQKFPDCPGMLDYSHAGYIITAHTDIHIKANDVGTIIITTPTPLPHEDTRFLEPRPFNYEIVEGMTKPAKDVEKSAWKIPLPWAIFTKKGYSAYVMPAIMHADYLDKIFVYPGIVDYDNFHVVNFVFSPLKECEFTIPAGTPLLQILPFKREEYTAKCDRATQKQLDEHLHCIPSRAISRYYRKFLSRKKTFKMTCPYDHRGDK